MNVLVTSTRMPFALAIVRRLAEAGHTVLAADTFTHASASHSRHVAKRFVIPSPRYDTRAFIDALLRITGDEHVDLYVPTFEEVFYVGRHLDELRERTPVFATDIESLRRLHDKSEFVALAEQAGLSVPRTEIVTDRDGLRAATASLPEYLARAAFSRGGIELFANTGPRAGELGVDDCTPTPENPWLVQEFVSGQDLCSYSVVHEGRIAAHVSYEIPLQMGGAAGMQFRSIDEPRALAAAQRVAEQLAFTGHLSFDYRRTDDRLVLIECNPRATDGALLMPAEMLGSAITDPDPGSTQVVEPGTTAQLDLPIALDLLSNHNIRRDVRALFTIRDPYVDVHDALPGIYQLLQFRHDARVAKEQRLDFMDAMSHDVAWDGAPIA